MTISDNCDRSIEILAKRSQRTDSEVFPGQRDNMWGITKPVKMTKTKVSVGIVYKFSSYRLFLLWRELSTSFKLTRPGPETVFVAYVKLRSSLLLGARIDFAMMKVKERGISGRWWMEMYRRRGPGHCVMGDMFPCFTFRFQIDP